jgi:hypothetical protein
VNLERIPYEQILIRRIAHDMVEYCDMNHILAEFVHENLKYEQYHITSHG